ncbi:Protein zgrf1, partial [Coemansia helicoidea]
TQADMLRDALGDALGQRARIQVSTVDAYQGSERDVIVISCVRTDKIGFSANPNRINVALSRARHHCLILGSRRLLETSAMWRAIIECCRADATGAGVMPAQALANRIATASAAAAGASDGPTGSPADAWQHDIECVAAADYGTPDTPGDVGEDLPAVAADDATENTSDAAGDGGNETPSWDLAEPYCDDSVIGGLLSQWSMACGGDSGAESQPDDVLDHLDVDLDEM